MLMQPPLLLLLLAPTLAAAYGMGGARITAPRMCAAERAAAVPPSVSAAASSVDKLLADEAQAREEARVASDLGLTLRGRLGEGHYGHVLRAADETSRMVAVKFAPNPAWHLAREAAVLRSLSGAEGFPSLLDHCVVGDGAHEAIVMELLGPSLQSLYEDTTASTAFSGMRLSPLASRLSPHCPDPYALALARTLPAAPLRSTDGDAHRPFDPPLPPLPPRPRDCAQ